MPFSSVTVACTLMLGIAVLLPAALGDEPARSPVDAGSLHGKVLCGYQGWFRCPGDGTGEGWLHWSRNRRDITPQSLTVEMWPDLSEIPREQRYPVPGFVTPHGQPAELFSSADETTVGRHFDWMQQHGIDGVFVQRFLVNLKRPSFDRVFRHVRASAERTGRVYAVCYDLSGTKPDAIVDLLLDDWKRLVDEEKVADDPRYLHHNGRPVLFVWGLYADRFDPAIAHRLIDALKTEGRYQVTLVGGCPWNWRSESQADWARAYRRLDVISPWNVGNYARTDDIKVAATATWAADFLETRKLGIGYLPVIYPGFGWANLKGDAAQSNTIPRRGGEFFWEQFVAAANLKIDMAYVAMFDEVDEATAIFKVSNSPPVQASFQTYENRPADWYLRLTGEGTKLLRGEQVPTAELPIEPPQ